MIKSASTGVRTLFSAYSTALCEAKEDSDKEVTSEYDVKKIEKAVKAFLSNPINYYGNVMPKSVLETFELPEAPDKFSDWSDVKEIEAHETGPIGIIYNQISYKYKAAWAPVKDRLMVVLRLDYDWSHSDGGTNGKDVRIEFTMSTKYDDVKIEVR